MSMSEASEDRIKRVLGHILKLDRTLACEWQRTEKKLI